MTPPAITIKRLHSDLLSTCLAANRNYAPGQYPHPLEGVPDEILKQAQQDYEAEVRKRATDKGAWHDTTQYYIYGQKPGKQ